MRDIPHLELDDIAAPKLTLNGQIEKGKVSGALGQLQSDPDRPDLSAFQWRLRPDEAVLFQGMWRATPVARF